RLSKKDTCVGKVYTMDELAADPQIRHRKMLTEFHDPQLGAVPQVGVGIKLSDTPGSIRSLAPKQGQHTEEVLRSLKYTPEQIAAMRQGGAVK
ncbi:MAG: CoA transferase, partial [Chloroflexota bacterium]